MYGVSNVMMPRSGGTFTSNVSVNGTLDATTLRQEGVNLSNMFVSKTGDTIAGSLNVNGALNAQTLQQGGITISFVPTGAIMPFAGASAPTGWFLCAGQVVNRTTFAALFGVIGITYGSGDTVSTFNIPDLRGRVVAGVANMTGTSTTRISSNVFANKDKLGEVGGSENVRLASDQCALQSHSHTASTDWAGSHGHTLTDPGHSHNFGFTTNLPMNLSWPVTTGGGGAGYNIPSQSVTTSVTTGITMSDAGNHSHTVTIGSTSIAAATDVYLVQPTMLLQYIIKF